MYEYLIFLFPYLYLQHEGNCDGINTIWRAIINEQREIEVAQFDLVAMGIDIHNFFLILGSERSCKDENIW